METPNLTLENVEKIEKLFPNCVKEAEDEEGNKIKKVDFDLLRAELWDKASVEWLDERYRLDRPWKKRSILKANTPITKTLRPVKEDSVDWDNTQNIYIEGDNFEKLKILQESYLWKIKVIYIDPPYNTGNDLIYKDDYSESQSEYREKTEKDDNGNILFKNSDTNWKYHSDWLSMMYERLKVARDLLKNDWIIFISIDDNELYNLKKICDEIFWEDNFINCIVVKSSEATWVKMTHADKRLPKLKEYLLVYKKHETIKLTYDNNVLIPIESRWVNYKNVLTWASKEQLDEIRLLMNKEEVTEKDVEKFDELVKDLKFKTFEEVEPNRKNLKDEEKLNWKYENAYRIVREVASSSAKPLADKKSEINDNDFFWIRTAQWKLYFIKNHYNKNADDPNIKLLFAIDYLMVNPCDLWTDIKTTRLDQEGDVSYNNWKKPVKLLKRILSLVTNENDIIMDFFSWSGTTWHAVYDLNSKDLKSRKFILVQVDENLDESYKVATWDNKKTIKEAIDFLDEIWEEHILSRLWMERLRRSWKKIKEETNADIDYGFRVYRVDESCMKDVYYHPSEAKQENLALFTSNIKEDRTPEDLLTQVILNFWLTLDLPIEEKTIWNNKVFYVAWNSLIACFDENIDDNVIDEIAKDEPIKLIFRDACFKNDAQRINVENKVKRVSPETIIKVI